MTRQSHIIAHTCLSRCDDECESQHQSINGRRKRYYVVDGGIGGIGPACACMHARGPHASRKIATLFPPIIAIVRWRAPAAPLHTSKRVRSESSESPERSSRRRVLKSTVHVRRNSYNLMSHIFEHNKVRTLATHCSSEPASPSQRQH